MDKNIEERIIEKLSYMCGNDCENLYDLDNGHFELRISEEEFADGIGEEKMESIVSEAWEDVMERFGTETTWEPLSDVAEFVSERVSVVCLGDDLAVATA